MACTSYKALYNLMKCLKNPFLGFLRKRSRDAGYSYTVVRFGKIELYSSRKTEGMMTTFNILILHVFCFYHKIQFFHKISKEKADSLKPRCTCM